MFLPIGPIVRNRMSLASGVFFAVVSFSLTIIYFMHSAYGADGINSEYLFFAGLTSVPYLLSGLWFQRNEKDASTKFRNLYFSIPFLLIVLLGRSDMHTGRFLIAAVFQVQVVILFIMLLISVIKNQWNARKDAKNEA